jgi:hypothetical protein
MMKDRSPITRARKPAAAEELGVDSDSSRTGSIEQVYPKCPPADATSSATTHDLRRINRVAARLNREAADVLAYQASLD